MALGYAIGHGAQVGHCGQAGNGGIGVRFSLGFGMDRPRARSDLDHGSHEVDIEGLRLFKVLELAPRTPILVQSGGEVECGKLFF